MPEFANTKAEFEALLNENATVVVDFTAVWCGPCKMIGPKFDDMEKEFPTIKFAKVDVDKNSEVAMEQGVSAMPTFKCYVNGEKVDEVVGADEAKLREMIEKVK
ncbi:glycerol ether metabolic process [Branchiostoma belcheri]|nr:glycerol ether metabolic process [Branchiostoma belcheri]